MKIRILLVALFLAQNVQAEKPSYVCAFDTPLIFGASNSSGYYGIQDGIWAQVAGKGARGSTMSPVEMLNDKYKLTGRPLNISEIVNSLPNSSYGNRQLRSFVGTSFGKLTVELVSALATIDASYWPSGDGRCSEALDSAVIPISWGKQLGKPVIIATVPDENPALVARYLRPFWYPPVKECVEMVNAYLKTECKVENQCYLIDLHATINQLNTVGIEFEGELNRTYDLRFDGIHLSARGKRYVMHLIEEALAKNPPTCAAAQ